MIRRYTRPAMGKIWDEQNKFRIWLEIEMLACEAQAELGVDPARGGGASSARSARSMSPGSTRSKREVKHDVIAFLTNVGEHVGPEARFIHLGMTSSDVLDTCLAVQMKQSGELLLGGLGKLADVLARRAREFKTTIMVGRTHGIHAEPTTFGLKLALWFDESRRNIDRLESGGRNGSPSGRSPGRWGRIEHLSPKVEEFVCANLGLKPAPVSTQILQRDRHAEFMTSLALIGSSLEKFATEIRHLQRTEVLEAEEYFSEGTEGFLRDAAQAQPDYLRADRRALAASLRGNALAAMENVALWHERDITHSSVGADRGPRQLHPARLHAVAHDRCPRPADRLSRTTC